MNRYYSNGKLLLTGEYFVLEGSKALALPTSFGQDLVVQPIDEPQLIWTSFDAEKECWFQAVFHIHNLGLISVSSNSTTHNDSEAIAEVLQKILQEARKRNPNFLKSNKGLRVKTNLNFPRNWGLGSSSTLLNNIAQWAKVDAYTLLWNAFSGSGYDIACAQNNTPILYQLAKKQPKVRKVDFNPSFKEQLYFIHLNKKQNSREGIKRYQEKKRKITSKLIQISSISEKILQAQNLSIFEMLINEHEDIIASVVELPKVKDLLFPDYEGAVKSLGAWGGDFVLATGSKNAPNYFKSKGYKTVLSYQEMVL